MSDHLNECKVKIFTGNKNFTVPKRQTSGAAGYDIYSPISIKILPKATEKIDLEFKVEFPDRYIVKTYMRSGLALKNGLRLKGKQFFEPMEEVKIEIENISSETFEVEKGFRIAQMVFHECV